MWNWLARFLDPSRRGDAVSNDNASPASPGATDPRPGESTPDWRTWLAEALRVASSAPAASGDPVEGLHALPARQLLAVDEALRFGWDSTWPRPVRGPVEIAIPDSAQREVVAMLFTLAGNGNGYTRQRALTLFPLQPDRLALAIALIRADDWVGAVRAVAERVLRTLLPGSGGELFALLPLVDALRLRERFAAGAWPALVEPMLLDPRFAAMRWKATRSADRRSRVVAYALLLRADPERRADACLQAIEDADPVIARWALVTVAQAPKADGAAIFALGLRHPAGGVRAASLRCLVASGIVDAARLRETLEGALFDEAATVRDVAAYWLREHHGVDARAQWRQALDAGVPPAQRIGLLALADHAQAQDVDRVRPFLRSDSVRMRMAALKAIARAQPGDVDAVLDQALCDPSNRVVAVALELFGRRPGSLVADALRTAFSANPGARRRLLAAVPRIDHWRGLRLLLEWLADAEMDERESVASRLRDWLDATNHRFISLPVSQRAEMQALLARARGNAVDVDWARFDELLA
jgi:hypothetical protein